MSRGLALAYDYNTDTKAVRLHFYHADGTVHDYETVAGVGHVMVVVCGPNWGYSRNGVPHAHYVICEYDTYVYDGKYLSRLGAKAP